MTENIDVQFILFTIIWTHTYKNFDANEEIVHWQKQMCNLILKAE